MNGTGIMSGGDGKALRAQRAVTGRVDVSSLRAALDLTSDAVLFVDRRSGVVLGGNREAADLWGWPAADFPGLQVGDLFREGGGSQERCWFSGKAIAFPVGVVPCWIRRRAGGDLPGEIECSVVDHDGGVVGIIVVRAIRSPHAPSPALTLRDVFHDELTDLPNRRLLQFQLTQFSARASERGEHFGLLFVDVNGFKIVNDTLGHLAGDQLLKHVAARLSRSVRPGDLVARYGGDEFIVLLENIGTRAAVAPIARRIRRALREPFMLDEQVVVTVSASVGIAVSSEGATTAERMIRAADRAMYRAKSRGRRWQRAPLEGASGGQRQKTWRGREGLWRPRAS